MLKSCKVTNFYSIGETQEWSLEIKSKDVQDDSARPVENQTYINLIACIIGANASGKTTILRAITFLLWFTQNSYTTFKEDNRIPIEAHKLRKKEPTRLEIEFFNDGTLFRYMIELNENEVLKEYLGKHVERDFSRIFEYERKKEDWEFKAPKLKINDADLERFKSRKNVSVLSSLIDTGYLKDISFFKRGRSNVNRLGYFSNSPFSKYFSASERLHKDSELQENVMNFLREIDLGISNLDIVETDVASGDNPEETEKKQFLYCIHKSSKGTFELPLLEESNGTLHSVFRLSQIYPSLQNGGLVILDEIDDSLHPHVVRKIVSLFENKKTNPNNAQLIFTTHQHLLLNDRTKTQIFLTEKNSESFETEIYRLDQVEGIRNDENYFQKYIAGVYGGTPHIYWF